MKELQQLVEQIGSWADQQFGSGDRTAGLLSHLREEIDELETAVMQDRGLEPVERLRLFFQRKRRIEEEFADVFLLFLDALRKEGISVSSLMQHTRAKLAVDKKREWGEPDETGKVNHIRKIEE